MNRWMTMGIFAMLLASCESKPDPAPASSTPASTPAARPAVVTSVIAPATAVAQAAAVVEDDLPTEEDFADEAEKEISEANLDAELDKLDKEIGE
jgi:hypothetical protein